MPCELFTQEMMAAGFVVMTETEPWDSGGAGRQHEYFVVFDRLGVDSVTGR